MNLEAQPTYRQYDYRYRSQVHIDFKAAVRELADLAADINLDRWFKSALAAVPAKLTST